MRKEKFLTLKSLSMPPKASPDRDKVTKELEPLLPVSKYFALYY